MKTTLLVFFLGGLTLIARSQNASVEKSTFGLQTGVLGVWAYNEAKLSNTIALRTEVGLDFGIWKTTFYDDFDDFFLLTPVITLEPRFYYNLDKRLKKAKNIDGNSGNFIAVNISYHPDWFIISKDGNIPIVSDFSIIPTWGIRRNLGKHFNYEAGIGAGFTYTFAKRAGYAEDKSEIEPNMHVRIGYRF